MARPTLTTYQNHRLASQFFRLVHSSVWEILNVPVISCTLHLSSREILVNVSFIQHVIKDLLLNLLFALLGLRNVGTATAVLVILEGL